MKAKIKGHFTCDNSYAVYLGDQKEVKTLITQDSNTKASQIFNGKSVEFEVSEGDCLYLIAWSDDKILQGLMASFAGSQTINTGSQKWKVLATKSNKSNNDFPTIPEINIHLNNAKTSDWKLPFVGSKNTKAGEPYKAPVKGIPKDANWIWYDSGKDKRTKYPKSPYVPFKGFNHDEFLIFKIPVTEMSPELTTPVNDSKNCCPQPIIINCCQEKETPKPLPAPAEKQCCNSTCVFEVRFQRWRYVSGKPGFGDGQAEIKFTCHVNGNSSNYPATNGSWLALNKRRGNYPKGWRAANARVGLIVLPCDQKLGVDIMTELMEVAKKEKGFSFEGGEPYGTSEVHTAQLECGNKPNYIRHKVKLEHGGNRIEDLELEVEYRFSQVSACACCCD